MQADDTYLLLLKQLAELFPDEDYRDILRKAHNNQTLYEALVGLLDKVNICI